MLTKTSVILGLGESEEEIREVLTDLKAHQVDIVTFGSICVTKPFTRGPLRDT